MPCELHGPRADTAARAGRCARALADGAVLALMATLGLLQLGPRYLPAPEVAMITMLRLVPMGLFGAFLGAFAERFDRRLTLAGIVGLMMVTSALLSVVAFRGALEVWHLAVASFINGCGWATDNPLRRVMMGEVMGRDRMAIAMALDVGAGMHGDAADGLFQRCARRRP